MADPFSKTPRVYYPRCTVELVLHLETYTDDNKAQQEAKTIVFAPRPSNLSIVRNGYNQADSFSMTFDAKDMPISPDVIRAGNTHIQLFDNEGNEQQGVDNSLPIEKRSGAPGARRLTFSGVIDDVETNFDSSGQTVTIQGQDFTALFIEKRYVDSTQKGKNRKNARRRIAGSTELVVFLQQSIKLAAKGAALNFVNETGLPDDKLPKVGTGGSRTNTRKGFPVKEDASFWDVMTKVAALQGFILYVRNEEVVLARPLKIQKGAKRPLYLLEWGNNIETLNISRKMGKQRTPRVLCKSYDEKTKKTISETYPKSKKQVATTGVGTLYNEIVVKKVQGVRDSAQLLRIAENWYNVLARSEQVINLTTKDMLDSVGRDLLKITTGDLVQINFTPFNEEHLSSFKRVEQKAAFLRSRGLPAKAAQIIAEHTELLADFKRPMYVRSSEFTWDISGGFGMKLEVINLVNINKSEDVGGTGEA